MDYRTLWIVYADGGDGAVVRGAESEEDAIRTFVTTMGADEARNVGARRCRDRRDLVKATSKYRLIDT